MIDPRSELTETIGDMSDEELIERWTEGHMTDLAKEVARLEFASRGIPVPAVAAADDADQDMAEKQATFVTVARSMSQSDIQILRARLEAEGIPALVADEGMNRMISLYSVAFGGMRLMVAEEFADEARRIIGLVRSGRLALREGDESNE